jgi:Riboflavin kinase
LQDFYGKPIRLSVVGYMRPELPFEGLEKLIEAIKRDIAHAVELAVKHDDFTQGEKDWVASCSGC